MGSTANLREARKWCLTFRELESSEHSFEFGSVDVAVLVAVDAVEQVLETRHHLTQLPGTEQHTNEVSTPKQRRPTSINPRHDESTREEVVSIRTTR